MASDPDNAPTPPPARRGPAPDFSGAPQPVGEFAIRPDFPECVLGLFIDIRGFAGVVTEIVNQSIKVRSPEGITQSFNAYRLKTLYAPPDRSEPIPTTINLDRPERPREPAPARPKPAAPARVYIAEPDFTGPVRPINNYAGQPDFPRCAYGKYVDVMGYAGVVVEIVNGSLKIQSPAGGIASYNSNVLRKLHGKA